MNRAAGRDPLSSPVPWCLLVLLPGPLICPRPARTAVLPLPKPYRHGKRASVTGWAGWTTSSGTAGWVSGAVVIFVLVRVLLNNWQLAVTLAVLAVIADTIIQSRTVTNPLPGARMTRAQRKTLLQLGKLEKAGYKALHARLIPDSEDHIDHLVIGPAGVFSIDSEYWDKHLPIRTKNARQLWHGPFSMKDRLEHARWESERAAELLSAASGTTVSVRPAMAVYGPKIPWDVATIRDVDVFSGGRLRNYLRRYARHNNARPLSPTDIDRIYKAAHAAFPHLDPGILAS
jgi:hypothetical protein